MSIDTVGVLTLVAPWAVTGELPRLCAADVIGNYSPRRNTSSQECTDERLDRFQNIQCSIGLAPLM